MSTISKRCLSVLLSVSVIWFLIYFLFSERFALNTQPPDIVVYKNLVKLRNAVQEYYVDHSEELPVALADLVPEYVGYENLNLFFKLNKDRTDNTFDLRQVSDTNLVAFVYLGAGGKMSNVIMYEKPGLWGNKEHVGDDPVSVLLSDFSVRRMKLKELLDLLN